MKKRKRAISLAPSLVILPIVVVSLQRVTTASRYRRADLSAAGPQPPCDGPAAVGPVRTFFSCWHRIGPPGRQICRVHLQSPSALTVPMLHEPH
jgi:hypothetical protein